MNDEELAEALDGLHAYDEGAIDSGIKNEELRVAALAELARRPPSAAEQIVHQLYLSPQKRAAGYSEEDAAGFREWLSEQLLEKLLEGDA